MQPQLDLSDVALVSAFDMAVPMTHLIDAGKGLVLFNGASADELRAVDAAVWDRFECETAQRVAVLVRFRGLVAVFASLRLKHLLLQKGFAVIAPALHVAASLRLNAERGFNPMKFERALRETMAALEASQAAPEPVLQEAA